MSVSVGNVTFDGAVGTPTQELSEAALLAWADGAKVFRFAGTAPGEEGSLDAWKDATEAQAQALIRAAGALLGYRVVVAYPHGSISFPCVATVSGKWQARRGTVNGGVVEVRFTFDRKADRTGDDERSLVTVQTAPALAGPWTTEVGWVCLSSSDGLGTYAGESDAYAMNTAPDVTKVGRWVRLVLTSELGDMPIPVQWTGVVTGVATSASKLAGGGQGSRTMYRFAGVAHVLAQLFPDAWVEEVKAQTDEYVTGTTLPTVTTPVDVGEAVALNDDRIGNKSTTPYALVAGSPSAYAPSRGGAGLAEWTVFDAARYCAANLRRCFPTMPPVNVTAIPVGGGFGDPSLLPTSVSRLSLLGMFDAILAPCYQLTFRVWADHTTTPPELRVDPVRLDAAAPGGAAQNLAVAAIQSWSVDLDGATQADRWYLDGGPRSYINTICLRAIYLADSMLRGWKSADETTWDAAVEAVRNNTALARVWCRWALAPLYAGQGEVPSEGVTPKAIPYARAKGARAPATPGTASSTEEETGELDFPQDRTPPEAAAAYPAGLTTWRFDRKLPHGLAAAGGYVPGAQKVEAKDGPLFFYWKSGAGYLLADYTITVGNELAAVELGRNASDALDVKTKITGTYDRIAATLSFVHPFRWRVSRVTYAPPRTDAPRVGFTYLPAKAYNRWDYTGAAMTGLIDSTTPKLAVAGRGDGGGSLEDQRNKFAAWFTSPDGSASWQRKGVDVVLPDPGLMVTHVTIAPDGAHPTTTVNVTIASPVARRVIRWDKYDPSVTWNASRIVGRLGGGAAAVAVPGGAVGLYRNGSDGGPTKPAPLRKG